MTEEFQQLREEILGSRAGQVRWRCPQDLREKVVQAVEQGRRDGQSTHQMAEALGLSNSGLRRWLKPAVAQLRPVRMREQSAVGNALVLVAPGGYRIEGLDSSSAAELLRRLRC